MRQLLKNKKGLYYIGAGVLLCFVVIYIFLSRQDVTSQSLTLDYDKEDLSIEWKEEEKHTITLNEDEILLDGKTLEENMITIEERGFYTVTGTLEEGQIKVDSQDLVQISLQNASIHCSTSAPIWVLDAEKVLLTLGDGTVNYLSDGITYDSNAVANEVNSTIFSKDDLVINGTGKLVVQANYEDAIASKDSLKIIDSEIEITANDDAIRGKDYVIIQNANIKITAAGDGIKSTNTTEDTKGYILIDSSDDSIHSNREIIIHQGNFTISSGDDGIHADTLLTLNGGEVVIQKSYEGLESADIIINGGSYHVTSSDDGINVAGGNDASAMGGRPGQNHYSKDSGSLKINGGYIYVDAIGDGLDSNGNIYMQGGTVIVNGPVDNSNGALDYDGEMLVTGGLLIASSSSGMLQTPSNQSTVNTIALTFSTKQNASTAVCIKDENGSAIYTFVPSKNFQVMIITGEKIQTGKSYTVDYGGSVTGDDQDGFYQEASYVSQTELGTVTISNSLTMIGTRSNVIMDRRR